MIGDNVDMFVDENDIAFHYNPRFDHKCIVRNTRVKVWGKEEWAPHRMPFMRNVPFTLIITIEEKCYKTAVNDSHFIDYDHRLPYDRANLLNISGEVVIDRIQFESPLPVVDDCRRNSIPRVIYSKSEGTYMSCVDSVPFDFVDLDQELEQESERINVPGANS